MRWLIVGSVGLLVLAGVVWSQAPRIARVLRKDVELTRRELPGAALLFPAGEVMQQKLDYTDGGLEIKFRCAGTSAHHLENRRAADGDESEAMMVKPAARGAEGVAGRAWRRAGRR